MTLYLYKHACKVRQDVSWWMEVHVRACTVDWQIFAEFNFNFCYSSPLRTLKIIHNYVV